MRLQPGELISPGSILLLTLPHAAAAVSARAAIGIPNTLCEMNEPCVNQPCRRSHL